MNKIMMACSFVSTKANYLSIGLVIMHSHQLFTVYVNREHESAEHVMLLSFFKKSVKTELCFLNINALSRSVERFRFQ